MRCHVFLLRLVTAASAHAGTLAESSGLTYVKLVFTEKSGATWSLKLCC